MSAYTEYFLSSKSIVYNYETIEISHPSFTSTKYIVRNNTSGLHATLETGDSVSFQYYPLKIDDSGVRDNLDQSITITFGDLGEVIPTELDAVEAAGTFGTKPICIYRTYRSDDLTAPMYGPVVLEIVNFGMTREGASFQAQAPSLNINRTGEIYTIDRFSMLRGFL